MGIGGGGGGGRAKGVVFFFALVKIKNMGPFLKSFYLCAQCCSL